ncbi:YqjF family protein [Bacillus atrophaeus]|uniref:YqjF family protein n=1 Tax=Bacillus atrophaeus TaxID=1452 RepID=UPI003872E4CB
MTDRFNQKNISVPKGVWIMRQTWNDVLFAHWPVDPSIIRDKVPSVLELGTYNGMAWISVLPFMLTDLRARFLPPIPGAHSFPELNFRTYVTYKGKPGIYFFSLDADHRLAVQGARTFFHLPYFYADMNAEKSGDIIQYASKRKDARSAKAEFSASYRPISAPFTAEKKSLDYWLTERYRLYTSHNNKLYFEDIHHHPWMLKRAEAHFTINTTAEAHGIQLPHSEPLLHYAEKQDVLFWPLRRWR